MDNKQDKIIDEFIINNYEDIIRSIMRDGLPKQSAIDLIKLYIKYVWSKEKKETTNN